VTDPTQSESGAVRASMLVHAALPWAGVVALGAWLGSGMVPAWLGVAAVSIVGALLRRPPGWQGRAGTVALLYALGLVLAAFVAQGEIRRITTSWDRVWDERETRIARDLERRLDELLRDGRAAALTLAAASDDGTPPLEVVQRLRRGGGFDAVAVFDPSGRPLVWDGVHRGRVPLEVSSGGTSYQFGGYALARYLYVTERTTEGGTAMLARLIDSDLPPPVRRAVEDLAIVVAERFDGSTIRIGAPDRVDQDDASVFDYGTQNTTLLSIRIDGIEAPARLDQFRRETRRFGTLALLLLWLLAAFGAPGSVSGRSLAVGSGVVLALVLPIESVFVIGRLAFPADSLLLGRPLGRWAWLLVAAFVGAAALRRGRSGALLPRGAGALFVAVATPAAGAAAAAALSEGFLADGPAWATYTSIVALGFGLIARVGIEVESRVRVPIGAPQSPRTVAGDGGPWLWGIGFTLVLVGLLTTMAVERTGLSLIGLAGAGVPILFWHRVVNGTLRREVVAWTLALVLGTSMALPMAWGGRLESRIAVAEAEMARLGVDEDPYLEYLLRDMGAIADSLDAEGLRPVELLYQTWRSSGLGQAGYPIHLTLWLETGVQREHLRIGAIPRGRAPPQAARDAFEGADTLVDARVDAVDEADAHYLLTVPLREGSVLTGAVPRLRELGRATLLGPLFESLDRGAESPLSLIPISDQEVPEFEGLVWIRTGDGWSGERTVRYPGQDYHAHWEIDLPPWPVVLARGTLLAAVHVSAGLLLVGLGVLLFGRGVSRRAARAGVLAPLGSFRARITVALFGFFAVSNLVFGSLAYRTIEGASRRAAELLATEAAGEAGQIYEEVEGVIDFLADRVGTEVLEYRDGELREGSIEPLVELGLYEAWVPYEIQLELAGRERIGSTRITAAGPWRYVTAYGRLPDGDVVGAPVPLDAGADAVRQAEVRDLLAFAMLLGAVVSLVLALAVGRALSRPIGELRVASERVGSGNLELRLPEGRLDEFGAVFDAFNRMVRRLRRARRNLVRTNRRTRAIVAEAATGVLAVDAQGRVSLVNDRARSLLRAPVEEGTPVDEAELGDIGAWLERYLREGPLEAGTEVQLAERRIRVRVRRIPGDDGEAGAVVSLEDVTDELRTERVLAWGEMARQVAHEVKNPLTPIKLSVQHVQRAYRDRRDDFGDILDRNAEAMLREIDRLAEIASSFSRLGAPEAAGLPIESVSLPDVVNEVLALYRGGQGTVAFDADVRSDLPPVRARRSEVKEVLVNLLENARAAMEDGGTVRITAGRAADRVLLAVQDDGPGIDEQLLARVFEPHFSTRSTGTGLGLAIVRRLVESWGADVTLSSRAGEGTTVTLLLEMHEPAEGGPPSGGSAV
jgi:signal transduction histidine kinase